MPLTRDERYCAGRKFARSASRGHVEMYFVPSIRGVIARSIGSQRIFRLPEGSISIGTYANPFNTQNFLSDLDDVIAKLDATQRLPAGTASV